MAGKGAPKGNKHAVKANKREGISLSVYIDAYTLELLQAACQLEGGEPTQANARKRALSLAKEAIAQDARQTFADPRLPALLKLPYEVR